MRYLGSKASLLPKLYELISKKVPSGCFCDPFGGVGVVGTFFKQQGYVVWTGDILRFAHFFQIARIQSNRPVPFYALRGEKNFTSSEEIVDFLNSLPPKNGWFVREYSRVRPFFNESNAGKIEAIRVLINQWSKRGLLTYEEEAVLLASLIESMDKVANTAGTYYAALKTHYRKARRPLKFALIEHTPGSPECRSFLANAITLVSARDFDVIYLDPPYNHRCYTHYYHLPETIAHGSAPRVKGKSGMPTLRRPTSDFTRLNMAAAALRALLKECRCKLLVFHYADNGLITNREIIDVLRQYGDVERVLLETRGYSSLATHPSVRHNVFFVHNA